MFFSSTYSAVTVTHTNHFCSRDDDKNTPKKCIQTESLKPLRGGNADSPQSQVQALFIHHLTATCVSSNKAGLNLLPQVEWF